MFVSQGLDEPARPVPPLLPPIPSLAGVPHRCELGLFAGPSLVIHVNAIRPFGIGEKPGFGFVQRDPELLALRQEIEAYAYQLNRENIEPAFTNTLLRVLIKFGGRVIDPRFKQSHLQLALANAEW